MEEECCGPHGHKHEHPGHPHHPRGRCHDPEQKPLHEELLELMREMNKRLERIESKL